MNVLDDPTITIHQATGSTLRATLPGLIALLIASDRVASLPRLAPDQRGYVWRTLVRCAAQALSTIDRTVDDLATDDVSPLATTIRTALLAHTDLDDWLLHQPDPSRPGFLQSPTPTGNPPADDRYTMHTCALLTAVVGAKEHERKSKIGRALDAEDLFYALIEYQGGVVFGGRGNYESQLMGSRSGAGSGTPFVGVVIDRSLGKTFRHDVAVLLDSWHEFAQDLRGSVWALWREPWDGDQPLPAAALNPAFIPYARMVRVDEPVDGRYERVWFRPSNGSRVADHSQGGNLGDPFTPLVRDPKGGHWKVRGALAKGYDYIEVVRLLVPGPGNDAMPSRSVRAALQHPPDANDLRVVFEGLAFEQGKTRGFHRREIRLPKRAVRTKLLSTRTEPLHEAHNTMLNATSQVKRRLRSALALVLTGSPRVTDDVRTKTATALRYLEEHVDRQYLDFLFAAAIDTTADDRTLPYRLWLFDLAVLEVLPEALQALPRSEARRLQQEISAEAYLRSQLRADLSLSPAIQQPEPPEEAA